MVRGSSSLQERFLAVAHAADARDLVDMLIHLTRLGSKERLRPEWKSIWHNRIDEIRSLKSIPNDIIRRIEEKIESIDVSDPEVYQIRLKPEDNVCIFLGAGASAPEPSAIPVVSQLLPELWRRARKIGRQDLDRLAAWCDSNGVVNIEDLLTAAYIANYSAKNASVTGLLDYFLFTAGRPDRESSVTRFRGRSSPPQVDSASIALLQDTLQTLFGLLTGTMIPARPNAAHDAIVEFVRSHKYASIVTTNYDGCIDEALIRAGVGINTYVDEDKPRADDRIDLIKIHGSINWSYCDSCQEVREFSLVDLKEAYEKDTLSYAVIGICRTCGGQRRPLLVPPLAFKFIMFPNLIQLWNTARELIERANYLLIVGYSFGEADTYISKIISRSLITNARQKLIICDPNGNLAASQRGRYAAQIDKFDPKRVLQAVGSADVVLPKILRSWLSTEAPGPQEPRTTVNGKRKDGAKLAKAVATDK